MRILGIDPGLRNTGFAIIDLHRNHLAYILSGTITTNSKHALDGRLKTIVDGLQSIITDCKPDVAAIEKVFVNTNPQSTLLLGQARGAAIAICALHNVSVSEYSALQVKKAVVGYGHADKQQVAKMVQRLLNLNALPRADAADALAVAITHSSCV